MFAAGHVVAALSDSFAVVTASRVVTALATGTFWATGAVVATAVAGPGASARALAVMSGGLSLAVVAGVPLGTFAGQLTGWRGPFWMLTGLSLLAIGAVLRSTPAALGNRRAEVAEVSVRAELCTLRPWRMWVVLGAIVLAQAGFLGAYSYISPLLTNRAGIPAALVPVVLVGFGTGALGGTALGGRVGDRCPLATIAAAVSLTVVSLVVLACAASHAVIVVVLVVLLGAILTGSALAPIALLAATITRRTNNDTPNRRREDQICIPPP